MTADGRSTRIVVLSAIGALIMMLCAVILIGVDRHRYVLLDAVGIASVPPPDPALANTRVRPKNTQDAFGDPGNYPNDARERGLQGLVVTQLAVAADGTVAGCAIVTSSGSGSLDSATCRVARQKVRFAPARDRAGRAVPASFRLRVR